MNIRAFAKINLGLKVLGKRADGFHDIETIFARVGLFDELEIKLRQDSKIVVRTENAKISPKENLIFRAAWLLQKFSSRPFGVEILLRKRIPIGAGLGGGSADAAAILKTLPRLWKLKIPPAKLKKLAASLGSDVPFFLEKSACWARGRGEILEPVGLPKRFPREALIVVPPVRIVTGWAYGRIKNSELRIKNKIPPPLGKLGATPFTKGGSHIPPFCKGRCPERSEGRRDLINHFEKIVFREFPEIRKIKKQLEKSGAEIASLSGSGSAVFGLFKKKPNKELIHEFRKFGEVFIVKLRD
ncbi:MAG: 4-(cytidine 5'-diphospho)-2-C-methyl-D-erythritol kinase [Candidatus Peribacteraceae bacterium]|nr:4-(cytidine 5'-diphospho)-2-C-methyl-D-erythritol kinase [Candidatus Peribacteraceae bacterium]